MVLYAAADSPLREIAETIPPLPLSVRALRGAEDIVRSQFSKPYVYFVGSHTGCSCGFKYGELVDEDAEGRASVAALGVFLGAALEETGTLELFSCWDGDEGDVPTETAIVTPSEFTADADAFGLEEGWFATVIPRGS